MQEDIIEAVHWCTPALSANNQQQQQQVAPARLLASNGSTAGSATVFTLAVVQLTDEEAIRLG
jgi:hypothetical protein